MIKKRRGKEKRKRKRKRKLIEIEEKIGEEKRGEENKRREERRGKEMYKRRDIEIENTMDVAGKAVDMAEMGVWPASRMSRGTVSAADWTARCRQVLGNVNLETLL